MSINKTKNADIKYGKKDVLKESDFEQARIGHRISIVIPEDVLMRCRDKAKEEGTKYQTLINRILRDSVFTSVKINIERRLQKIERIVFKKKSGIKF